MDTNKELIAIIEFDATPFREGIDKAIAAWREFMFGLYARAGRPYGKSIRGFKKWRKSFLR